ncbi:MAG: hypothetical protein ABW346_05045, partial [Terrimicrobium sp.]
LLNDTDVVCVADKIRIEATLSGDCLQNRFNLWPMFGRVALSRWEWHHDTAGTTFSVFVGSDLIAHTSLEEYNGSVIFGNLNTPRRCTGLLLSGSRQLIRDLLRAAEIRLSFL